MPRGARPTRHQRLKRPLASTMRASKQLGNRVNRTAHRRLRELFADMRTALEKEARNGG
jgi:hypothetical protein